jgi:nitroreductase
MSPATPRDDAAHSDRLLSPTDTEVLLRAATRAPSLHNSQPWIFAVGSRQIELYADPARQLHNADPAGRSLLVSCGAALFNLRVAAEHQRFHPHVRLLPEAADPTHVAVVRFHHRRPRAGGLARYFPAVAQRQTNRLPFRAQSLPHAVLAALDEAVRAEGAMLRCYNDPAEVARIIGLLNDADLADARQPARTTERQAWVGGPRRADGIPAGSLGPRPTEATAAFRDLGHGVGVRRDFAEFEASPTVAILSTAHDKPIDWVRAGQALERLLLEATAAGVSASFLNQPLEHESLRRLVASPTTGIGHSQMIVRLGYGPDVPVTPRRPLDLVQRPAELR